MHRITRELRGLGCLLGICLEFARNSEFARKTARTSHARNSPVRGGGLWLHGKSQVKQFLLLSAQKNLHMPTNWWGNQSSRRRICRARKAGLGSQSSAEPLGFCTTFPQEGIYYVKRSAEPSCRTPKAPQNSGEPLRARICLLRTGFLSSHLQKYYIFADLSLVRNMSFSVS